MPSASTIERFVKRVIDGQTWRGERMIAERFFYGSRQLRR